MSVVARLVMLFALAAAVGCAKQHSTRMTVGDFQEMSAAMAQSLAKSPALVNRSPQSPRMVVSIDKVQNLTSDVMTAGEQWGVMAKVRGSLPIQALRDQKNIVFVIPPEQAKKIRAQADLGNNAAEFGSQRSVTHTMTATFRSLTRAVAKERTEAYYCEFEILDLAASEPIWTDRFEYRRAAEGHIWD